MASICVHRAPRTPPDSTPGHIGSLDVLQEARRTDTDLPHTAVRARFAPGPSRSCKSPGTAIAIPRASRAHQLARWHRFVSIERCKPLQASLQGTSARAMIFRNSADLPRTALRARLVHGPSLSCNSSGTRIGLPGPSREHPPARWHRFESIERREPLQTALQGTSARAMFCRKKADLPRTCHARPSELGQSPVPHSSAIHLARQSPFYGPPGHIGSRDGIDLCPSSTTNHSRRHSRAN